MLYDSFKEHPYNRLTPKDFKKSLNLNLKELHFNIIYLEEKGLLELQKPLDGDLFVGARITPKGIDLVEDEYQMSIFFAEDSTTLLIPDNIFEEFNALIKEAEASDSPDAGSKELIVEELREIEKELKNTEPSYSVIKGFVDKLRERDSEVWKKLLAIIKDPAVTRVLSTAAKKELGI